MLRAMRALGLIAIAALGGCAHRAPAGAPRTIEFDSTAIDALITWSRTGTSAPPAAWKDARAFELTREWARWSGMPDPEPDIGSVLEQIHLQKLEDPALVPLHRVEGFLDAIRERQPAFLAEATPHLERYLPEGTAVGGKILFAIFIPPYAFAWGDGSIVINLTASYWAYDPNKVMHLLVHELFHNGYVQHQRGAASATAETGAALKEHILWQTQNEGLATYVAYRARPHDLFVEDYALIEDREGRAELFEKLSLLLTDAAAATPEDLADLRKRVVKVGNEERAFYVVGATMALVIEERLGRKALVETIERGPHAFFEAYLAVNPPHPLPSPD